MRIGPPGRWRLRRRAACHLLRGLRDRPLHCFGRGRQRHPPKRGYRCVHARAPVTESRWCTPDRATPTRLHQSCPVSCGQMMPASGESGTRTEEGDRLRTDSTRRRRGGPERRVELEHNRCRNAYEISTGRKIPFCNNHLVLRTTYVSRTIIALASKEPGRIPHRIPRRQLQFHTAEGLE